MAPRKSTRQQAGTPLHFVQLITGQWQGDKGFEFSLIGLSIEGLAYRYVHSERAWVPYPTEILERR